MRLIDACALCKKIKAAYCEGCANYNGVRCRACNSGDFIDLVDDFQTVDAEPVVRCKDCIHAEEHYSETIWCYLHDYCENRDGYCYRGERRE